MLGWVVLGMRWGGVDVFFDLEECVGGGVMGWVEGYWQKSAALVVRRSWVLWVVLGSWARVLVWR